MNHLIGADSHLLPQNDQFADRPLQNALHAVVPEHPAPAGVELAIDVDPLNML